MVKRLVVKLRSTSVLPEYEEQQHRRQEARQWQRGQLREAVRAIQASRDTPATLEELFCAVESEVQDNEGGALHALLGDECQRKAATEVAVLAEGVALESTTFLQHVVHLWETYSSQLSLIRRVETVTLHQHGTRRNIQLLHQGGKHRGVACDIGGSSETLCGLQRAHRLPRLADPWASIRLQFAPLLLRPSDRQG